MQERRLAPSRRVLKAGMIVFGGSGVGCRVRNVSNTGAALDLPMGDAVPDQFRLIIEVDAFMRRCRIVWRNMGRIGVTFV